MRHLRQILSISLLVTLLSGCGARRHWAPESCPKTTVHFDEPPIHEKVPAPASVAYQPTVYKLDSRRRLEVWYTADNGHYSFLQDGKVVRTEPIMYCSAEPLFPDNQSAPESPACCLNSTGTRYVIVRQQGDDNYSHSVYKVASGFKKVGEFNTNAPITIVKVGTAYSLSGNDFLPGFGAQGCYPKVMFKLAQGKLKLDREAMMKALPTQSDLRAARRDIRAKFIDANDIPSELFDYVFAYYYCGKVKQAKAFFNSVYPQNQDKKAFWWNFIKEQISQSQYRKEIEEFAHRQ